MERISIRPRDSWVQRVEALGFMYHQSVGKNYWHEAACYRFSPNEIEALEQATQAVYAMYCTALTHLISRGRLGQVGIPAKYHSLVRDSWRAEALSLYGRFDFRFDGKGPPKLYEFNADTPTSLFEAAVVQWFWLQDVFPTQDQFNSIHEKLITGWQYIAKKYTGRVHFTCIEDHLEDLSNTEYLRDTAIQAGLDTEFLFIGQLGWDNGAKQWRAVDNESIKTLFKLYPWEWLMHEDFGEFLDKRKINWIEPIWKVAMSSKAMLPVLWELFPNSPYLLPAYFTEGEANKYLGGNYVKKPFFSREGANIEVYETILTHKRDGDYGYEGHIYQQLCKLPVFQDEEERKTVYPVIGSWLIGGEPAGLGIREADGLITDDTSRFIPHYIE